ncbi:MAG: hypothetical protein H6642_14820 [Caldilineaceae bacterium]|nr:hypothetical protein [Caldilineaceae bacterium]
MTQQETSQTISAQSAAPAPEADANPQSMVVREATPASIPAAGQNETDGVFLLSIYHFVLGGLFMLGTLGVSLPTAITAIVGVTDDPDALIATAILGVIAGTLMFLTVFFMAIGYGLLKRRQWARIGAIVVAGLSLFGIPIGTVIGGLTIWYLIKPEVAAQFER